MKIEKTKVSRTVETPGQSDQERSTTVSYKVAENAQEALEICGNDLAKFLSYFNGGRWAELRTMVSNTLANKTPAQRAVDKMISAFKTLNPSMSDAQLRTLALSVPGIAEAAQGGTDEVCPTETDEAYFYAKSREGQKEAKAANGVPEVPNAQ